MPKPGGSSCVSNLTLSSNNLGPGRGTPRAVGRIAWADCISIPPEPVGRMSEAQSAIVPDTKAAGYAFANPPYELHARTAAAM